jgi:K+-transporting ATPase ATPase A chain
MQLGEVVFGGVGSGLYGMLVFAILAVFIAGLMIGRTPEYLGKKIETFEMKMVAIAILVTPLLVLGGTALAVLTEAGRAGLANPGAHGFSECSTPSARRPTTTAAPSPGCRPTRSSTT